MNKDGTPRKPGSGGKRGNPGGRPPGTLQTAASVLTGEIIRSTKLMAETREVVGKELGKIESELKGSEITLDKRLDVMKALTEIMQALGKAVGDASKCLMLTKGEDGGKGEEMDVEAWLKREITGVRG